MHVSTPKKTGLGYESALETFSRITSNTSSLKRFLRIVYKALKFHSEIHLLMGGIANSGTSKLALQLRESVEILTTAHTVNLAQELTCPNKKESTFSIERAGKDVQVGSFSYSIHFYITYN